MSFTRRIFLRLFIVLSALAFVPTLFAAENNANWSFAVIADTQWSNTDAPFHGVAIHVIDAINAELIRQKVDFVIQVGDLVEKPSAVAFQTRAAHNKALANAGIKFYPVRGNHDVKEETGFGELESVTQFKAAFPNLPGMPGTSGSSPDFPSTAGLTYSFTHKGGKFILLDTFPKVKSKMLGRGGYLTSDYLPWIESELKKDDHRFAFVFAHKGLRGQFHNENIFGPNPDSNPETQNTFIACLQNNGVKYFMCGHDHLYHRAQIKSPDGKSEIGQIVCGSATDKFYVRTPPLTRKRESLLGTYYTPTLSFIKDREKTIAKETFRVGFVIVRVEGEQIRFEYYSTQSFGDVPKIPVWERRDAFGYALEKR
jgi:hypothetical protein